MRFPVCYLAEKNQLSKYIPYLCLFIAVVVKIILQVHFFSIMDDKSYQLLGAKNLIAGNGLSINQVLIENTALVKHIPLVGWPPGYSLVIAPFLLLFGSNFFYAALAFDVFCVFPFFYYLYKLISLLALSGRLKNLFILSIGFFIYPFGSNNCTDFAALICMLAAVYYSICFTRNSKKNINFILIIVSLLLAVLFRYLYLPVIFSLPAALLIAGSIQKKKEWAKGAYRITGTLLLAIAAILLFQKQQTGEAIYIVPVQKGLYFEHLLKTSPFIPGSFFDVQIATTLLVTITGKSYQVLFQLATYLNLILLLFLFVYSAKWLSQLKLHFKKNDQSSVFILLGMSISTVIVLMLFYLSVTNGMHKAAYSNRLWTFVQESRYYAFCILFIQLVTFVYLFNRYGSLTKFWKAIALTAAIILSLQFVHRIYYTSKLLMAKNDSFYMYPDKKRQLDLITTLPQKIKKEYPDFDIIVTSVNASFCNLSGLYNVKSVYDPTFLNHLEKLTNRKTKIIAVLSKASLPYYSSFIKNSATQLIEVAGDQYFYLSDAYTEK